MIITKGSTQRKTAVNAIHNVHENCARQNGIPESAVRKFINRDLKDNSINVQVGIPNNQSNYTFIKPIFFSIFLKNYVYCIQQASGFLDSSGKFNDDVIAKFFLGAGIPETQVGLMR